MKYLETIKQEIYKNTMLVYGRSVHTIEVWDYHQDRQWYELRELYINTLQMYIKVDIQQFWSRIFEPNDSHFTGRMLSKEEFETALSLYNDYEYEKTKEVMEQNER